MSEGTQCVNCRHRLIGMICEAFPEGIPLPIWRGEQSHLEPVPGDHGIQYERLADPIIRPAP